jgi:hypothetical protein
MSAMSGQRKVGLAVLALGVVSLVETFRINDPWTGARLLPLAAALALLGLGIAHWVAAPPTDAAPTPRERGRRRQVVVVLALLGLYVALLSPAGFFAATAALIAALTRFLGGYSWPLVAVLALGLAAAAHLVFVTWLGMPLPLGPFAP